MRKCICCGGFYIEIEDSTYRFDSIPQTADQSKFRHISNLCLK